MNKMNKMNKIDTNIKKNFTDTEKKVFETIDSIRKKRTPYVTVRVAGGWVRDKLLGQPSDDIDFMLDNISGAEFANIVAEELNLNKVYVIDKNPEKTKNIEAAKMHIPINGEKVELDFVQSRTEEYGNNRREVEIKPASAEEDAMRRDLTIGSLFYNVNENKIEDFTGKGIKDLITGTIRTPYDTGDMDSYEKVKSTFIEDPLRVFRAIRFAAKYNGKISEPTYKAIQDPEVINAIFFSERKIATDRIGQELKKILKGNNPEVAIKILKETGLFQNILNEATKGTKYEGKMEKLDMEQKNPHHELNLWGHTFAVLKNLLDHFPQKNSHKKTVMILAALTHDLGKLYKEIHVQKGENHVSYHGHEDESQNIAELILKYLRFENDIVKKVSTLVGQHMKPHSLVREDSSEKTLRRFVRKMGEKSLDWLDVFNLAVSDAYSKGLNIDPKVIEEYKQFEEKLNQAVLSMSEKKETKIKPILNGKEIMDIMNVKPSSIMSVLTEYVKDLMDDNPNITKEQATIELNKIKSKAEELDGDYTENIQKAIKNLVKTAQNVSCHLSRNIAKEIKQNIKNKDYYQAMTRIKEAMKHEDIYLIRKLIILTFDILRKEPQYRDNEILTKMFKLTEKNMHDPTMSVFSLGLLILLKTSTKKESIINFANKVLNQNKDMLRVVLKLLPKDVYHKDIKNLLEEKI